MDGNIHTSHFNIDSFTDKLPFLARNPSISYLSLPGSDEWSGSILTVQ